MAVDSGQCGGDHLHGNEAQKERLINGTKHRFVYGGYNWGATCRLCGVYAMDPVHNVAETVVSQDAQQTEPAGPSEGSLHGVSGRVGSQFDPVESPAHYVQVRHPYVDVVVDWQLDFFCGQVLKYISRHQMKGTELQDLKKAARYLAMKIELMETGKLADTIKWKGK